MCRHLAYVGPPVRLADLLVDPPHSLVRQSWAPRRQRHGVVNADGFGIGWYLPGRRTPVRHRGGGPVWADETFADLADAVVSGAFLAAVRSATTGAGLGPSAAAPFRHHEWLFSHNGALHGWPGAAATLLRDLPDDAQVLEAPTDSALLWAMTRTLLDRGAGPGEALATVVALATAAGGGRLNLLLTDGHTVAATAAGASLTWRQRDGGGVLVGSEPHDDSPGWNDVPDGHLLVAGTGGVELRPLPDVHPAGPVDPADPGGPVDPLTVPRLEALR